MKNLKLSKWQLVAVLAVLVYCLVFTVMNVINRGTIRDQKAEIAAQSDSLVLVVSQIGELQTMIKEMNADLKKCNYDNQNQQIEISKWKIKYYEQKTLQTDCESMVDHAVLNNTPPDLQGLLLANRLVSGKTNGFRLVVPQQPDKPDE